MIKELIICIIIVVLVIGGNYITQKYTETSVAIVTQNLMELRKDLMQEDEIIDKEETKNKIDSIYDEWMNRHNKLASYIEHDELEKTETDLSVVRGYVDIEEYKEAVTELDKTVYVLEHIKNKTLLNLQNIF